MLRQSLLVVLATLCATGCGIKEDVPYKVKILFESDVDKCSTQVKSVDLATEKAFADNKQYIQDIAIRDVTLVVTNANVNGKNAATEADGAVAGAKVGSDETFAIGTYAPVKIENGASQTLTVDPASQKRIKDLILADESKFDAIGSACVNTLPYSFETELTINFEITAGAF